MLLLLLLLLLLQALEKLEVLAVNLGFMSADKTTAGVDVLAAAARTRSIGGYPSPANLAEEAVVVLLLEPPAAALLPLDGGLNRLHT